MGVAIPKGLLHITSALYSFFYVLVSLSIISFSSSDRSFSTIEVSRYSSSVDNIFGALGAYVADMFLVLMGIGAFFIPIIMARPLIIIWKQHKNTYTPSAYYLLFNIVTSFALVLIVSFTLGFVWGTTTFLESYLAFGILGAVSKVILSSFVGGVGGIIMVLFLLPFLAILYLSSSFQNIAHNLKNPANPFSKLEHVNNFIQEAFALKGGDRKQSTLTQKIQLIVIAPAMPIAWLARTINNKWTNRSKNMIDLSGNKNTHGRQGDGRSNVAQTEQQMDYISNTSQTASYKYAETLAANLAYPTISSSNTLPTGANTGANTQQPQTQSDDPYSFHFQTLNQPPSTPTGHASMEHTSVEHASVEHASVGNASVEHANVEHANVGNASVGNANTLMGGLISQRRHIQEIGTAPTPQHAKSSPPTTTPTATVTDTPTAETPPTLNIEGAMPRIPNQDLAKVPDVKMNMNVSPVAVSPVAVSPTIFDADKEDYNLPYSFLQGYTKKNTSDDDASLWAEADVLNKRLNEFGIGGRITHISSGPVVITYEFEPAPGVKVSRITALSDDIALAMSVASVRVIAPIPGKGVVGFEIPRRDREMVVFKQLVDDPMFKGSDADLNIAIGQDVNGKPYFADLAKMPHVLIAGTTGSGKSVAINTIICSLVYNHSPDYVKFIMIDPKMVELSIYDDIPHLAAPVVTDTKIAAKVLRNVVKEMEQRYALLKDSRAKSITSYNAKAENSGLDKLSYLVVIVDEFADLMMVAGKEVEQSVIRLAQMARAVGIHLILATQRPSVDVITGIIKANMPSRLGFKVSSKVDSRTVIDRQGAEQLLGNGDSLFIMSGREPIRLHGSFISEDEVNNIADHLRTLGEPEYDMALIQQDTTTLGDVDDDELDEKYYDAVDIVTQKGFASISMVQRHLRIGYNRAARIVEIMEQKGIVAPSDGSSKPREVLRKSDD